jgi:hypothetical protein
LNCPKELEAIAFNQTFLASRSDNKFAIFANKKLENECIACGINIRFVTSAFISLVINELKVKKMFFSAILSKTSIVLSPTNSRMVPILIAALTNNKLNKRI